MTDAVIVPVFNPEGAFRIWYIDEIYTGNGGGRYVPNVNDMVWSWATGMHRVVEVDYTTGLSILHEHQDIKESGTITNHDILLGGGPGTVTDSYRLYVDTSVMPHTVAVDTRLRVYGSNNRYAKIFRGSNISSAEGKVISRTYNENGEFIDENLGLELVANPDVDNVSVKTPSIGHTVEVMDDGELVTLVIYNDAGSAVSINKLVVKNTAFIRTAESSARYITGIHIESPFISEADPQVLQFPMNMPTQAVAMMGVVTYSDGGKRRIPIDGNKFSLFGMDGYISTMLGQRVPLALNYKLSADEAIYDATSGGNQHNLTESYFAETVAVDGTYTVKLFCYPVWMDPINGYRLEYFLFNLDREDIYYATPFVHQAANSRTFNPTQYGILQNVSVAVNLNEVNGLFSDYRHVQTIGVTLKHPGHEDLENWTVQYNANLDPIYGGRDAQARGKFINEEHWELDISCAAANVERWLDVVYRPTLPLYDPTSEHEAPTPNFFKLVFTDRTIEYPIEDWSSTLTIPSDLKEGQTIFIEFIKRTSATDLHLAIAGIPMHQDDTPL